MKIHTVEAEIIGLTKIVKKEIRYRSKTYDFGHDDSTINIVTAIIIIIIIWPLSGQQDNTSDNCNVKNMITKLFTPLLS